VLKSALLAAAFGAIAAVASVENEMTVLVERVASANESIHEFEKRALKPIDTCVSAFKGSWALSFDDGPYPVYTNKILDTLKLNKAKATFAINGYNWRCIYDSDVVATIKRIHNEGHQIISHGWRHADEGKLSKADVVKEIQLIEVALTKILGFYPLIHRFPYGSYSNTVLQVLQERGYKAAILWTYDSTDSFSPQPSASTIAKRYATYATQQWKAGKKGQMSLNHDVFAVTRDGVKTYLPALQKQGWKMGLVGNCLGLPTSSWYKTVGSAKARDSTWTCAGTPVPGEA